MKNKINGFIKRHKRGLIIGSLSVAGLCALGLISCKIKIRKAKISDNWNNNQVADLLTSCLECAKESTDCLVITGDDLHDIVGNDLYINAPDSSKLLINSMMIFGEKAE